MRLNRGLPPRGSANAACGGQALVEALVTLIALTPVMLLVIVLGKYQSLQDATISASRKLAFECSVRIPECDAISAQMADELRRRFFSRPDVEVFSRDAITGEARAPERNALWVDGANRPLLERYEDVGARVEADRFDVGRNALGELASAALSAGPERFGLDLAGGLIKARLQVDIARSRGLDGFAGQLQALTVPMMAHTAVLIDGWNASGPHRGDRPVERIVEEGRQLPGIFGVAESAIDAAYFPTRTLIQAIQLGSVGPFGLETQEPFRYHELDVDIIPADRIIDAVAR